MINECYIFATAIDSAETIADTFMNVSDNPICHDAEADIHVKNFFASHDFIDFPELEQWELEKAILKPREKSSPEGDGIRVTALRKLWSKHKPLLTEMFNRAFRNFPKIWKNAVIAPIPKGDGNFRPIAMLSQLGKTLERVVSSRLEYLVPLPATQFGCRAATLVESVIYRFYNASLLKPGEVGPGVISIFRKLTIA